MEERLKKIEDYLFTQNYQQQTDIFENVLQKFETDNGVGIGKRLSKDNAALLEITSIKKGLRSSRMTTAQRDTITNPGYGLIIFNLTTNTYNYFDGTNWIDWSYSTSGTYTPTLTNTTNVSASTPRLATYNRVGNSVTVAGQLDIDPTAPGATLLGISLPIVSDFTTVYQLGGIAVPTSVGENAGIEADATNNRASLKYTAIDITNHTLVYTFTYQII